MRQVGKGPALCLCSKLLDSSIICPSVRTRQALSDPRLVWDEDYARCSKDHLSHATDAVWLLLQRACSL